MIIVKLLGGAKKLFSTEKLEISSSSMTLFSLLEYLGKSTKNLAPLDPNNILVAVNGIDSSALQGKETLLKDGDVISIIPLIHGGSSKRLQFELMKNFVELVRLKPREDPIRFIESIREHFPNLIIQGILASYVLNIEHVKKTLAISISAQKTGTLLSNKIETDILLRFACTKQISDAISKVGVKKNSDSILIIVGKKPNIEKLFNHIEDLLHDNVFSKDNSTFIKQKFGISKKQLDSIFSKTPLEDLLAEKSATLFH